MLCWCFVSTTQVTPDGRVVGTNQKYEDYREQFANLVQEKQPSNRFPGTYFDRGGVTLFKYVRDSILPYIRKQWLSALKAIYAAEPTGVGEKEIHNMAVALMKKRFVNGGKMYDWVRFDAETQLGLLQRMAGVEKAPSL